MADRRPPEDSGVGLGRPFGILGSSSGLSNLADGAFKVGLPLVAVHYTRSPALIAGIEMVRTLPWLLFALPIGVLTDRLDRRQAMIAANVVRALMVLIPAVVLSTGGGSIWLLYAAAIGTGVAEVFYDTSAQSILPNLVARTRLSRANGRLAAIELGAQQFVGPPLAGALVAITLAAVFWTSAALWVAAIVLLFAMRGRFQPARPPQRTSIRADIAEGVRFLVSRPLLRAMAVMVGIANLTSSATGAVLVLFAVGAESALGLTEAQFGFLLLATAIGSISATFLTEWFERHVGRARTLTISVVGMTVFVGAPAVTANIWALAVAMLIGGMMVMLWNIPTVSFRQRVTPDHLLGRLNSVYRMLAWGTMPLGALLGGLLAEWLGVRAVFAIMGVLTLTLLIPNTVITDERLDDAEARADLAREPAGG